jgi:prevent-host-death family protein
MFGTMRLTEDIRPITQMKTRAATLVREVTQSRRPIVITQHGEAKAVLLDVATYQSLRDATLMLRIVAQGEADVVAGRTVPQRTVLAQLRRRLRSR